MFTKKATDSFGRPLLGQSLADGSERGQAPRDYSFQGLISQLQDFWIKQGVTILQPHDKEMGAGTFHPATFLGALGPQPCSFAYVQPSRRPTDGRYGQNPNRLQHYYQFQALIKPAPLHCQTLYLKSLQEAFGLQMGEHDVRFIEDNWESPTLGAWGLGWEVWLNGMEVSQFTYFQQVGGEKCDPVALELTYGLERLAMYLQRVFLTEEDRKNGTSTPIENVYDLFWSKDVRYGDLFHEHEIQQSTYNFEQANVEKLKDSFDFAVEEGHRLISLGQPVETDDEPLAKPPVNLVKPAYEQLLTASHQFNMLDARGVISVAERQRYVQALRMLANSTAKQWVLAND